MINVPSNELGESSSGGPWLTEESGRYFIVGLNSHARPGIPGMFSPKLDSLTAELYRSALAIVKGIRGTDLKPEDPFDIEPGDQVAEIGGQHQSVHQSIIQQSVSSNQSNDNRSFRCNQMSCELNCGSSYQYSCINGVESCHCAG